MPTISYGFAEASDSVGQIERNSHMPEDNINVALAFAAALDTELSSKTASEGSEGTSLGMLPPEQQYQMKLNCM